MASRVETNEVQRVEPQLSRDVLGDLLPLVAEMNAILDRDELLRLIPQRLGRVVDSQSIGIYVPDAGGHLRLAGPEATGDPADMLRPGEGIVGTAARLREPLFVPDVSQDRRYLPVDASVKAELAIPLIHQDRLVGVLNLEGPEPAAFTPEARLALQVLAVHLAGALANATLYQETRRYAGLLETLHHIGRETASLLDLDRLLERVAESLKRVIDYEMFGILLVDEAAGELVLRKSVRYCLAGQKTRIRLGEGFTGWAAVHAEPVLAPDVTRDPRYLNLIPETRSELVVPLIHQDRVVGVFDLESTEVGRFNEEHVKVLTPLASQVAVAIENARLYEELRRREARHTRELAIARRVQQGLLPEESPRGPGWEASARFRPAREVGGDLYDFYDLAPDVLGLAVGDVTGKGIPAALYASFASGTVRAKAMLRVSPAEVLGRANRTLRRRGVEGRFCTLVMARFDFAAGRLCLANSGLPYPLHYRAAETRAAPLEVAGIPLGALDETAYDELEVELRAGDAFVFVSDGITEAGGYENEFGAERLAAELERHGHLPAAELSQRLVDEVQAVAGDAAHDDMTLLVVKILG